MTPSCKRPIKDCEQSPRMESDQLNKEKTLVNQGETGEKAEKKGGNAVYFVPVLLLKIEGKADRTAKVYKFICQYFDQTKLVFIRDQTS